MVVHPRVIAAVVGVSYLLLGYAFMRSSVLRAWPSSLHWGMWAAAAGVATLAFAARPSHLMVAVSGTLTVAVMAARAVVLTLSLLFDEGFGGARGDTALAGLAVAVPFTFLIYTVWSRLIAPYEAFRQVKT